MFANSTEIKYVNKQSCRLNIIVGKEGAGGRRKWKQLHNCKVQSMQGLGMGSVSNVQGADAVNNCWRVCGYKSCVSPAQALPPAAAPAPSCRGE